MGIMDAIKRMSKNKNESSQRFKDMQEQDKLETMLIERKKSANQRELERHFREKQENEIKEQLDKIRKKRNKDSWKGNSILKGGKSILEDNGKSMSGGKSILKDKNIFLDQKANMPITKQDMFFKW
jgi:hypothetical protein